jgi:opacity protein-like surface antigen
LSRRAYELGLSAHFAQKLCPTWVDACDNTPGVGFQAEALQRANPLFAWGIQGTLGGFDERLRSRDLNLSLRGRGAYVLLVGRVAALTSGPFDPYIQAGFGGGSLALQGEVSSGQEPGTNRAQIRQRTLAPVYQASAGLDFHVSGALKVGGVFSWTHWLLSDFERCTSVAFGVCSGPEPGRFDLTNAVWSLGVRSSVVFGQSL